MKKIYIIGGGGAGFSAAQAAKETDPSASVTLICGEGRLPYFRPRICEIISGLPLEELRVKPTDWYTEKGIQILFSTVRAIDPATKQLELADGSRHVYDALVLATGSNGNIPKAEGTQKAGVTVFRSLAQVEKAQEIPGPVLIIGAGLLGLEAAWHLSLAGRSVAIADHNAQLLSRQLDAEAGAFFTTLVEKAGVRPLLAASLTAIDGDSPNFQVHFQDGRVEQAALVVFAAGVQAETTLAKAAGLEVNRAIAVNAHMETNQADIYACGDCAELEGKAGGLWSVAQAQGQVAGSNAAGGNASYTPVEPAYIMNAMGTKICSSGDIRLADAQSNQVGENFWKLFFAAGKLAGFILIGDTSAQAQLQEALESGMPKEQALALLQGGGQAPAGEKYVCGVCGYVLDLAVGTDTIAPGTAWEDVPEDFTCPVCGVPKAMFEKA